MNYKIRVKEISSFPMAEYEVKVEGESITSHRVKVKEDYYKKLTDGVIEPDEFVRRSFEFLLEREPNTSILKEFSLELIEKYFPEYQNKIKI